MKNSFLLSVAVWVIVALAGCDKPNPAVEKKLAELERQNREAFAQKQHLERQLADQQLASERDAIERERSRIEDDRAALEQAQDADAAAQQEDLAAREQALAKREGNLDGLEATLEDKQQNVDQRDQALSGRELELAGREAVAQAVADSPPAVDLPVADYGTFYDSLTPYGAWLETPDYGYVWQPAAVRAVGWRPYLDGSWACTNHGWTWISNEPFGWACYHYGRWARLREHGWIWVPGDQWAPAWVCWRGSGSHIGWAPLPPETIGWRNCTWDSSVETRFGISPAWFNFVDIKHFSSPIRRHCLPVAQNNDFWQHTDNITNIRCRDRDVFVGGPSYQDISRSLGRPAPYYQLNLARQQRPSADPLAMRPRTSGHQLNIAAPAIRAEWNAALSPARVRARLPDVAIERPKPLAPEVVNHFRQQREQDQRQADQALTQLGGRQGFNQRRTQVLEINQRQLETANQQKAAAQAEAANQQKAQQTDAQRQRTLEDARQRQLETANQQKAAAQAEAVRQRQAEAANQQKAQQTDAQRQRTLEDARQRQLETANQQKAAAQAEAANQQKAQQAEAVRQRQTEAANQQKAQQAEAQRQRALEDARQRQLETANQQKTAQAAAAQQLAQQAEAQRQRAAEESRQRQAEGAAQQRAQQAEAQRQRAAEESRQRQQAETKKQEEDARQRRSGR